ncbi:MAG: hypothetical protein U9P82_09730 [Bacteroidota bacterium]|nr:hypothetical protein [Bacteroidota bacterium]
MKKLIVVFFILFCNIIFLQAQNFTATISREYNKAEHFSLINNTNDTIISFDRNGHINSIQASDNNYLLKKRKVLFDSKGDTIAYYKRRNILFPLQNIIVTERRNKNGWIYYLDNHKILEIDYTYNKEKKNYYITALSENLDEITINLLQLSLGRFDKRVVMDYDDDDDFSTAIIIAIIVALSS